jgi:hypothetical protein
MKSKTWIFPVERDEQDVQEEDMEDEGMVLALSVVADFAYRLVA